MIPSWETSCVNGVQSALSRTRSCLQVISLFTFPLASVPMSLPTINLMLVSSPTPAVAGTNSRANYIVKQRTQYRSPIMGSEIALTAARNSALAGHVPPGLIPFLASPNADIIQHCLNWTLRFPLPGHAPHDLHAHRCANLSLYASGHSSNESLRNAIQLHQTFFQTNAMVTNPTFLRVLHPSNTLANLRTHL